MSKSIVNILQRETPQEVAVAMRRYAELLRGSAELSQKELEELKRLMVCLGKTAHDVGEDQQVLATVDQHRKTIKRVREMHSLIEPAGKARDEYEAETKSLLQSRATRVEQLRDEYSRLLDQRAGGDEAVEAINKLKSAPRFSDLLAHEPAAEQSELSAPLDSSWQQ